jgi:3-methyladenine DNA glycosylase Tag
MAPTGVEDSRAPWRLAKEQQMSVDEAVIEADAGQGDGSEVAQPLEDGRTRCAWVRGRPEHYLFHDAEWGRLPDVELPCFELVMLSCFERDIPLVDVLDQRMAIYEAFGEWDYEAVAGADDASLESLCDRGGLFGSVDGLKWIRDVAAACVELKKDFKGVRDYFLAMPGLDAEAQIQDVTARFPNFTAEDAARLIQTMGCVGGAVQQWSHERDCWIY